MARNAELGEFEHLLLLAILRLRSEAYAPEVARVLEDRAGREMSRGTLYAALDRLEERGLVVWELEPSSPGRSGMRRRRFEVTPDGARALAACRQVFLNMWDGVEALFPADQA